MPELTFITWEPGLLLQPNISGLYHKPIADCIQQTNIRLESSYIKSGPNTKFLCCLASLSSSLLCLCTTLRVKKQWQRSRALWVRSQISVESLKMFECGSCCIGCQQWQDRASNNTADVGNATCPGQLLAKAPRKRFSDSMRILCFKFSTDVTDVYCICRIEIESCLLYS